MLLAGPRRFTEIERALVHANPKMVTARLRELEAAGLVSRTVYAEVPPRVVYALTERGRELRPAIEALRKWGTRPARRARAVEVGRPCRFGARLPSQPRSSGRKPRINKKHRRRHEMRFLLYTTGDSAQPSARPHRQASR